MKLDNPAYCSAIFKGLYFEKVDKDTVNIASCCINKPHATSSVDFVNDSELNRRRELISKGIRIPECKICWEAEDSGSQSMRYNMNSMESIFELEPYKVELVSIDYTVDPVCNAKCIMCGSYFSSLWAAEDWEFNKEVPPRPYKNTKQNDMLDKCDFSKLRRLYFNGGEPFLTDDHVNVLKKNTNLSKTFIVYNTNGSILPSEEVKDLWNKSDGATINASIDGIGSSFEYIRNPLKWDLVSNNIKQLISMGYTVKISYTLGIHNLLDVKATREWFRQFSNDDFNVHLCSHILHIRNAPRKLKEIFLDYLKDEPDSHWVVGIRNILESNLDYEDNSWIDRLNELDVRRNNSWRKDLIGLSNTYIAKE